MSVNYILLREMRTETGLSLYPAMTKPAHASRFCVPASCCFAASDSRFKAPMLLTYYQKLEYLCYYKNYSKQSLKPTLFVSTLHVSLTRGHQPVYLLDIICFTTICFDCFLVTIVFLFSLLFVCLFCLFPLDFVLCLIYC